MKKNSKSSKSHKRGLKKSSKQKGGVSNACVLPYAESNINLRGSGNISGADIHNLNPQASYDLLDNKTMLYGQAVPLGQTGGNVSKTLNKCGDEGGRTNTIKNTTFKQYLQNLDSQFSLASGGSSCGSNSGSVNKQKGSGYIVDTSQMIAGNPVYESYPDNNPPVIIGDKIIMGAPDKSVCGNGATRGGHRNSKNSRNSRNSHNSSKSSNKSNKSKKEKRNTKKSNHNNNNSSKYLRGGDGDFVSIGSKPSTYADAFNGQKGVFKYPDDMKTRDFSETQPNYSANAI